MPSHAFPQLVVSVCKAFGLHTHSSSLGLEGTTVILAILSRTVNPAVMGLTVLIPHWFSSNGHN